MPRRPSTGPSVTVGGTTSGTPVTRTTTSTGTSVPQAPTVVIVAESFYYKHTQTAPASEWTILHNLGKRPNISVFVDGDEVLVNVQHISDNTAHIIWPAPVAGEAYCS